MDNHSRRGFLSDVGGMLLVVGATSFISERCRSRKRHQAAYVVPPGDPRDLPAKDSRLEVRTLDTPRSEFPAIQAIYTGISDFNSISTQEPCASRPRASSSDRHCRPERPW